jgi:uncharacterized damage-inducible protein DinB
MSYDSLSQIFDEMDQIHSSFYQRVESFGPEEIAARPSPDAWTVGQIVEHVGIVEQSISKLITVLLMKAEAAGVAANEDGSIEPISVEKIVERSNREKYQAPETAQPTGNVSIADAVTRMRSVRDSLEQLRPRLQKTNSSGVSYPHPAFGPMNLYEWLILLGIHERRHLAQIESIISQPVG